MPVFLVLAYLILAVLVGWLGRDRAIGFAGFFAASLFLTPFVMALILLISVPAKSCADCDEAGKVDV